MVAFNADDEVGKACGAREDETTLAVVILCSSHRFVIVRDNRIVNQDQCRSSVGNGVDARGLERPVSNAIAGARELPKPVGRVDRGIRDLTRVLAIVDESKVVCSRNTFLQINREHVGGKCSLLDCRIKKGGLLFRHNWRLISGMLEGHWNPLTGVDGAKGQPKQAVIVLVLLELSTDFGSELNSLLIDGHTTNIDCVKIDIPTGTRTVSIGDVPARAVKLLSSVGLGGIVEIMTLSLSSRKFRGENPSAQQLVGCRQ